MAKGLRFIFIIPMIVLFISSSFAQSGDEINQLYRPLSVVKRLSYENFKNIKLLHAAIMNYGQGAQEFDRLVDMYAEASAMFFQNKIDESAKLFVKNEKEILEVSQRIAAVYKEACVKLHTDVIKMKVKYKIKKALKGDEKENPTAEKLMYGASFGIQKANDLHVRERNIKAIFYYRRTKDQCFKLYKVLDVELPDKFEKDMIDNRNQVYTAKEKQI